MLEQLLDGVEPKMQKSLNFLIDQFSQIRGAGAQTSLVDSLKAEVYGQTMVLKQIATITTPDSKTIAIQPWDKTNIPFIEKAIREVQELGLNPSNDGNIIRLNVPPLTEERRQSLIKIIAQKQEEAKVSLRNVRHEAINQLHKMHKTGQINPDQLADLEFKLKEKLNKFVEKYSSDIDQAYRQKEKEMLEI